MDRPRRGRRGARAALLLVAGAPSLLVVGTVDAAFQATAVGPVRAAALTVASPGAPTTSVGGPNVTVSWPAVDIASGVAAGRYTVRRYAGGGALLATLTNCATGGAVSCVDSGVADGSYRYTVAAGFQSWNGPEGPLGALTVVGAPTFTITSGTPVTALPAIVSGTVTGFAVSTALTFRLDSPTGPILSSSPSTVQTSPSQAVTFTLPAGTTDGARTIFVIGSDGRQASAALTVAVPPKLQTLVMRDLDGNGKVDRVVATFDEALAPYSAGIAPWTLTNTPSGGTLTSVTVTGSQATLTIAEGAGAADTAVGAFTVALATNANGIRDAAGNRTSFAATAPTDGAGPVPMTITDTDGTVNGLFQLGDTVSITFSEPLLASTVPTTSTLTLNGNTAPNNTLTLGGISAANRDLGAAGYLGDKKVATFAGSAVTRSNGDRTVTVTVGVCTGDCSKLTTQPTAATYSYLAATTLTDPAGNPSTTVRAVSIRLF